MRSPCYECKLRNEDKNNERCRSCERRIAYAQATQLISSETSDSIEEERMTDGAAEKIMTVQEMDVSYKEVLQDIEDLRKEIPRRKGKKRGRKSLESPSPIRRPQMYIKFGPKYFDIHRDLVNIAELEH